MNLQCRLDEGFVSGGSETDLGERSTHACNCAAMNDAQTVLGHDRISRTNLDE